MKLTRLGVVVYAKAALAISAGVLVAVAAGSAASFVVEKSRSPYSPLGGDSVTPTRVRIGDKFVVSRSFRVTRQGAITVSRTMVRGDCNVSCEIVDLYTGALLLGDGEYRSIKREFIVPITAVPGAWSLEFAVHWDNAFGRSQTYKLPSLKIEVVP